MSRTSKSEWSRPDGSHMSNRLERQARPGGRLRSVIDFEMAADAPDSSDSDGPL